MSTTKTSPGGEIGGDAPSILQDAANDAAPFDGLGAGDWGDQWLDQRLQGLYQADEGAEPSPRLAELMRRLEASLHRDRKG